jgi:phosphonate transport system substrate-binding protein
MTPVKSISLSIACALGLSSFAAIADINMGVFPRRPIAITHKAFKPLAEKLSNELGEKVNLIVAKNFKAFWKGVESGQYDLVHYNQYHYILSHQKYDYRVIVVNQEFGSDQIAGALTVRKDNGINSVADLKGKTILFGGGKKAMGSYIAPTAILKKAGLSEGIDYKVKFAKNPPSAVIGVYHKAAAAAGSGNVILKTKTVNKKTDTSQLKTLAESEPFIQLTWAIKGTMPAAKAEKIKTIMTSLKDKDDAVLKAAKVNNFISASDSDFAKVREIVKYVTGQNL